MKIVFSEEIKKHKRLNYPILALESTILAHGMPYPNNYTFAKKVEDNCRKTGVAPSYHCGFRWEDPSQVKPKRIRKDLPIQTYIKTI